MSVAIIKAFVQLRQMALSVEELADKLTALEMRYDDKFKEFKVVFDTLFELMVPPDPPRRSIGFHSKEKT